MANQDPNANTDTPASGNPLGGLVGGGVDFDLEKVRLTLRESILVVILIFVLINTGAYLYVRYTKPIYRSSSVLKLEFKGTARDLGLGIFRNDNEIRNYLTGEIAFISSRRVAERVIERLHLEISYYVKGRINDEEKFPATPFDVTIIKPIPNNLYDKPIDIKFDEDETHFTISYTQNGMVQSGEYRLGEPFSLVGGGRLQIDSTQADTQGLTIIPSLNYYITINSQQRLIQYLQRNLSATILNPNAQTLRVSFTDPSKYKAAAIVDAVNEVYLKETIRNKNLKYEQTREYLNAQLISNWDSLERYEKAISDYRRENGIQSAESRQAIVSRVMQRVGELTQKRTKLLTTQKVYRQIEVELAKDSLNYVLITSLAQLAENPTLAEAVGRLRSEEKALEKLSRIYTEETVAYREQYNDYVESKYTVEELLEISIARVENEIYLANNEIRQERARIPDEASTVDLELKRLRRYLNRYSTFADLTLEKIVNNNILEAGTVPDFKVLSRASQPEVPIFPKPTEIYTYAFLASLLLSTLWVAIRYLMQNKITNVSEMERLTAAPILGVVPLYTREKMEVSQLVVNQQAKAMISEAFRSIRTNLEFVSFSGQQRILSVTSTVSGEGKTFVAINLGGIIAQSGIKVVILDLDMRRPKVHKAFNTAVSPGMSTVLTGKHAIKDTIRATNQENLFFLPAGAIPPNPSELIMSPRFEAMINELKEDYQVIILDTPPVGLVTDGELVMRYADVPLYIVRLNRSLRSYAGEINFLYEHKNIKRLSVILNGAGSRRAYGYGGSYGGYRGYGYGYYEESEEKSGLLKRIKQRLFK